MTEHRCLGQRVGVTVKLQQKKLQFSFWFGLITSERVQLFEFACGCGIWYLGRGVHTTTTTTTTKKLN